MGTWGTGIFDDDTAGDVRDAFEDELSAGADVATAAERVLGQFSDDLDDTDYGPVIYLALAALQLEHRALQQDIRDRALQIIDNGEGLDTWGEAGSRKLHERKQVLASLRAQLTQ
jgi:hypothetical protein